MTYVKIFSLFLIALCFTACENEVSNMNNHAKDKQTPSASIGIIQTESTIAMVSLLKEIYDKIDPFEVVYFENANCASKMKKSFENIADPIQRLGFKMRYGMELISAGRNENAITVLTQVVDQLRPIKHQDMYKYYLANRALAIGYLRVAEVQNCLKRDNPKMCLMPLAKEAQFLDKQSLNMAINILKEILTITKDNEEPIWLLNFAYMASGTYPDDVPLEYLLPPSAFDSDYDLSFFNNVAYSANANSKGLSGGAIMDDFNNDGFLDLIATSWDQNDGIQILINDKNGHFKNVSEESGLHGINGGLNIRQVDYNNDGYLDIFVLRGAWFDVNGKIPNSLLKNMGDGTFSDVTKEVGLLSYFPTQTCLWRDFNFDGLIDLFIANESNEKFKCKNEFYIQEEGGMFVNIIDQIPAMFNDAGFAKGCAAGDLNNDGLEDIFISYNGQANKLFLNTSKGANISFVDVSISANVVEPIHSFPTWFWDYDNDGWEDLLVAEFGEADKSKPSLVFQNYLGVANGNHPRIFKNNKKGAFIDQSKSMGMTDAIFAMGSNFGDLDNDGFLDFYLATGSPSFTSIFPNRMFRNNAGNSFQDVTTSGGFGHLQKGHGVAFGDMDNDGDQDVFCVLGGAYEGDVANDALFQNPGNDNAWITLKLVGHKANRAAIGARVKVVYELINGQKEKQYHTIGSGSSFGGNSLQLECGLADAKSVSEVTVTWPNQKRSKSVYQNIKLNTSYILYELDDLVEKSL